MSMSYPAGGGGNFKSVPAGTYIAVCNMLADLGLQPGSPAFPDPKHKVAIRFEIPAERVEYEYDGVKKEGPMTATTTFTASMNGKANLRKFLEGWRGQSFNDTEAGNFDIHKLLGVPALLTIVEYTNAKGEKKTKIGSAARLMKGMAAPKAENELLYYMPPDDESQFNKLPGWVQDAINGQVREESEPGHVTVGGSDVPPADDDIPFAPYRKRVLW